MQNFRFVVLKRKDNSKDERTSTWSNLLQNLFYLVLLVAVVTWFARKQYIYLTGQHKKRDNDYV